MKGLINNTAELIAFLNVFYNCIAQDQNGMATLNNCKASSAQWLIAETIAKLEENTTDGEPNENIKTQERPSPEVILFCGRRNGKTQIIKEFLKANKYKTDADLVLGVAKHCEIISKRGGEHAKEYHKIAQHLKKSAGHLKALERNPKT